MRRNVSQKKIDRIVSESIDEFLLQEGFLQTMGKVGSKIGNAAKSAYNWGKNAYNNISDLSNFFSNNENFHAKSGLFLKGYVTRIWQYGNFLINVIEQNFLKQQMPQQQPKKKLQEDNNGGQPNQQATSNNANQPTNGQTANPQATSNNANPQAEENQTQLASPTQNISTVCNQQRKNLRLGCNGLIQCFYQLDKMKNIYNRKNTEIEDTAQFLEEANNQNFQMNPTIAANLLFGVNKWIFDSLKEINNNGYTRDYNNKDYAKINNYYQYFRKCLERAIETFKTKYQNIKDEEGLIGNEDNLENLVRQFQKVTKNLDDDQKAKLFKGLKKALGSNGEQQQQGQQQQQQGQQQTQ